MKFDVHSNFKQNQEKDFILFAVKRVLDYVKYVAFTKIQENLKAEPEKACSIQDILADHCDIPTLTNTMLSVMGLNFSSDEFGDLELQKAIHKFSFSNPWYKELNRLVSQFQTHMGAIIQFTKATTKACPTNPVMIKCTKEEYLYDIELGFLAEISEEMAPKLQNIYFTYSHYNIGLVDIKIHKMNDLSVVS